MSRPRTPAPLPLLARLVRPRLPAFAANLIVWGGIHALPALYGLLMKGLFDALAGGAEAAASPWSFLALAVGLDLLRLGGLAGGVWLWADAWAEAVLRVRRNLLEHLLTAPGTRRPADASGEAISRFRDDVDDVAQLLEDGVDGGGILLFALVAVGVMLSVEWRLTVLALVPLLLTLGLAAALQRPIRRARRRLREATGRVTGFVGEATAGALTLKAAGREAAAVARFARLNEARRRAALRDAMLSEGFRSVTDNMVNVALGLMLLQLAGGLARGAFSVGDFALFVAYLPRLTEAMWFFGAAAVQHERTGVAFERLEGLLQDAPASRAVASAPLRLDGPEPRFRERRPARLPLERLEVRGLTARHEGGGGIEGVDLRLERGDFVVVTGRVGAGKTTLLRALLGLLPRDAGEVLWNDAPVRDPASFLVPPRSAYTPQVPRLFSDSLRENVRMGRPDDPAALAAALELAVLAPDVARLEHGLDTAVGARGVRLSGGQVQRAAAARMFVQGADLLVVDDLSSALDVDTERRLWEGVARRGGGTTCLVVSHRRAALRRADRIVVLAGGRVADAGTLPELLRRSPELRALWRASAPELEGVGR